jgi:septal ring factor EnvC (AmiA/AmiB activator)
MNESLEVKLARIEEKLDALCHSVDQTRATLKEEVDDLWSEMRHSDKRLQKLEAREYQRDGGRAMLVSLLSAATMFGGVLGYFLKGVFF